MIACWAFITSTSPSGATAPTPPVPSTVEGAGHVSRAGGGFDAVQSWKVRFEFARAAPVTFVNDGTPGFSHGIRFVGQSAWVHVKRGMIEASSERLLRDPQNKYDTMPVKLPVSNRHTYNFVEAIQQGKRAICDIETAVRATRSASLR